MTGWLSKAGVLLATVLCAWAWSATAAPTASSDAHYKMKVVAISRTVPQWALFEFFRDEAKRRSNGRLDITLTSTGDLGVQSFDMIRLMKSGIIDIGNVVPLHVSGSVPLLEATELPSLFPDVATNRKAFQAWTDQVLLRNEDKVGGHVIGSFGWAGQMLFARKPISALSELKGMKIRVTSKSMSDYVGALGGIPVPRAS